MVSYPRVASFRTSRALAEYLASLGCPLPIDETILPAPLSPLSQPLEIPWLYGKRRVGNRFAVQPMEGWDGEPDGRPSELTRRRWLNFGRSGAKLIWGGEAVAVLPEGRANPNQLIHQYLGWIGFREPVPAYKHSAAIFLKLTGGLETDEPHPRAARREASDCAHLVDAAKRLERIMHTDSCPR